MLEWASLRAKQELREGHGSVPVDAPPLPEPAKKTLFRSCGVSSASFDESAMAGTWVVWKKVL